MKQNLESAEPSNTKRENLTRLFSDSIVRENALSGRQLTRMIYLEGFGAAGLTYPAAALWSGGNGFTAFIFYGSGLILLLSFFGLTVKKRNENGVHASSFNGTLRLPVWAAVLYLLRFFIHSLILFCFFGLSIQNIYMPGHARWWLLLPFALLLGYCTSTSLQKRGRFLELVFPWAAVMFALVIIIILSGMVIDFMTEFKFNSFFSAAMLNHTGTLQQGLLGGYNLLLCSSSLEFIYLELPLFIKHPAEKENNADQEAETPIPACVIKAVLGGYLCSGLLCFVTIRTLGRRLTVSTLWPVVKIMQLIHLPGGFLERFDILLALYWILCMVVVLSGYLYYGKKIAEDTFGREYEKHITAFTAVLIFLIYIAGCLWPEEISVLQAFWAYKKWIDFPLLLLVPFLVWIMNRKKDVPSAPLKKKKLWVNAILPFILIFMLSGCRKQSDAEKKRYVLSLYADLAGDAYDYYIAEARLSEMGEKESLVPCRIKKVRAEDFNDLEREYKRTETGQPEWNHIYTIFIGPGLCARPRRLIQFLKEWDGSWQKSPDVSMCFCDLDAEQLFSGPEGEIKNRLNLHGQQVRGLIGQMDENKKICRTPIEILKEYYRGAKRVDVYRIYRKNGEWAISSCKL